MDVAIVDIFEHTLQLYMFDNYNIQWHSQLRMSVGRRPPMHIQLIQLAVQIIGVFFQLIQRNQCVVYNERHGCNVRSLVACAVRLIG